MDFPAWDQAPHLTVEERGGQRLKYVFMLEMMKRDCTSSLQAFAGEIGVPYDNLKYAIRKGRCSPGLAIKIEQAVGRDCLPHEFLTDPTNYIPRQEAINA